jgi:hypothetical protein
MGGGRGGQRLAYRKSKRRLMMRRRFFSFADFFPAASLTFSQPLGRKGFEGASAFAMRQKPATVWADSGLGPPRCDELGLVQRLLVFRVHTSKKLTENRSNAFSTLLQIAEPRPAV